jgi:SAM-dependent methyltransferase
MRRTQRIPMSTHSPLAPDRFDGPATMPSDAAGWWEVERAKWIRSRIAALTQGAATVADVGCGRGAIVGDETMAPRTVVNVDSHRWANWETRPGVHYVLATADALPFRDGAFDLVGSFDVLEHLSDDRHGLSEQARIVRPGGAVVSAVPADPRLWSVHDEAVGHHRRYTADTFRKLAAACGLAVERATHFFSFLWLPARMTRRRALRQSEPGNGGGLISRTLGSSVALLSGGERRVLRRRDVPFGTSLWVEMRRPQSA